MFKSAFLGQIAIFLKKHIKLWIIPALFLLVLGVCIYITWLIEPSSDVKNILISNISDHQATISWTTKVPTRGELLVSSNFKFPILPIFSKDLQKDDLDKTSDKVGYYTTHHITIGSLDSSKRYNFRVFQGQKKVFEGSFKTGPTITGFIGPSPIYGKVLRSDKKTPVVRAIVYLRIIKNASSSALLSTLTNGEGGWSLDLANLRDANLRNHFILTKKSQEQIIIEAGNLGRVKAATTPGKDKPWPTIKFQ